jgi:bacterioferritin-associated ferredoxin
MTKIRFEQVYSQRLGISTFCVRCNKKLKRTVKEEQTVNPWNRNKVTGTPFTRQEVWNSCEREVKARVKSLETNGTLCGKCQELGTPATPEECQ